MLIGLVTTNKQLSDKFDKETEVNFAIFWNYFWTFNGVGSHAGIQFIYFASVLSHLVTVDLSRFVQVEYSLINNEHKLDTLTITT